MSEYRLSENALRDLDQIVEHAEGMEASPRKLLNAIRARCSALTRMPESGRSRVDLGPGLRSGLANGYLIIYVIEGDDIVIARILHGRRNIRAIFRKKKC